MVAILEKSDYNIDFLPMVDFIEASPHRYALTVKPTVYVSHIRQFWSTARIETTEEGTQILATVDGIHRTVTESSLRRNIKLQDEEGISSLPDMELFENLTLMGYNISPNQKFTFQKDHDRATIDKSSTLPYDSAPRVTSLIADEGSMQHTIPKLMYLCTSLQRQLSELTTKFQAQEVEINRLKERVMMLEDKEGVAATRSGDDAPIKGRSMDEGEAATERISDDSEEMATVLTSMDASTVLASGVVDVPTSSGSIPTASTLAEEQVPTGSDAVPTASLVFATTTVVARELEEQLERENQRRSEQIAREAKIARIYAEEELQLMIDGLDRNNETVAKYMQEYHQFASELSFERRIELITDLVKYQDNYANIYKYQSQQRKLMTKKQKRDYYMSVIRNNLGWKVKDFIGMTFEEVEAKFNSVWKQMEDFIPMGSKEEAKKIKRKGLNLEQESAKKQKTSEEVPKEAMSPKEVPKEKVYIEGQRSSWKITRLGGSSANYQFFIDLLKHLDREDLNQLWRLVKETLSNRPPTSDKEMEIWVELSSGEGPSKEGSSTCDDQLQALSSEMNILFWKLDCSWSIKFRRVLLRIKCTRHFNCQFPLAEQLPTASEERCHYKKKSEATARKIALLSKVKKKLSVKVK
uniref:Xylulose kinase-1 n=1 Tax=Tanacetum cinerariifolium TaxID=118510 RepID=A0A699I545_TANCI|nr:hypothetical protein [Tanacetum cinerariifolium]